MTETARDGQRRARRVLVWARDQGGFWWAWVSVLGLGVVGAVGGGVAGYVTTAPCSAQGMICFSPGSAALLSAVVGGAFGVGIALVVIAFWLLVQWIRRRVERPRLRRAVVAASITSLALPFAVWGLVALSSGGGSRCSGNRATGPVRRPTFVLPRVVQRISFIAGAELDPGPADEIARRSRYAAWVKLYDDHTADIAVWPSLAAAMRAARRYEPAGRQSRPINVPGWPTRLVRIERIRNVTIAWYTRPTNADKRAVKTALLVPVGSTEYSRLWAIPGAVMDAYLTDHEASYEAEITPGGCGLGGCTDRYLDVAIFPSEAAAVNYFNTYKDVSGPGPFECVKNAAISWNYRPSPAQHAAIVSALH
jgi:hypothetical protein